MLSGGTLSLNSSLVFGDKVNFKPGNVKICILFSLGVLKEILQCDIYVKVLFLNPICNQSSQFKITINPKFEKKLNEG